MSCTLETVSGRDSQVEWSMLAVEGKGKDGKGLEWQEVPFFSLDRAPCHLQQMEN